MVVFTYPTTTTGSHAVITSVAVGASSGFTVACQSRLKHEESCAIIDTVASEGWRSQRTYEVQHTLPAGMQPSTQRTQPGSQVPWRASKPAPGLGEVPSWVTRCSVATCRLPPRRARIAIAPARIFGVLDGVCIRTGVPVKGVQVRTAKAYVVCNRGQLPRNKTKQQRAPGGEGHPRLIYQSRTALSSPISIIQKFSFNLI
jgi:hypothetical protein